MYRPLAHPCVFPIALRALVALFPLFGVYDDFIFRPKPLLCYRDTTASELTKQKKVCKCKWHFRKFSHTPAPTRGMARECAFR